MWATGAIHPLKPTVFCACRRLGTKPRAANDVLTFSDLSSTVGQSDVRGEVNVLSNDEDAEDGRLTDGTKVRSYCT